jgi:tetratricopeptide (TPR) repeat protein
MLNQVSSTLVESVLDKKAPSGVTAARPQIATTSHTHEELIEIGDTFFMSNELEPAEKAYQRAKELIEDAYGVPPSKVAYVLTKLANLYFATDRFHEARPLYERVLEIQKKVFGANGPEVTRALEDLGDLYDIQDRLPDGQRYYDEALNSMHQQKQLDEETAGRLFKKLLSVALRSGEPVARARIGELAVDSGLLTADKVQTALQTAKETGKPLGTVLRDLSYLEDQQIESLMFAQVLVKQGTLPATIAVRAIKFASARQVSLKQLCEAGRWVTSRDLNDEQYKQLVLEQEQLLSAESNLGPDNPEVAEIAQRVAEIHLTRKDKAAAEALFKRALSILQKAPGTDKLKLLTATERLAEIYCQHAKYAEAQPLLLKALEYRQSCGLGETVDTAKCLWLVGKVELAQCNHITALSMLRSARAIFEKATPGETPKQLLEQMVSSSLETGSMNDIEPVLNQLIERAKDNGQAFEPETANYMEQLGDYYMESGKSDAAQAQYYGSMQIYERAPGAQARAQAVSKKLTRARETKSSVS